jgi:hypothetical protein
MYICTPLLLIAPTIDLLFQHHMGIISLPNFVTPFFSWRTHE